MTGILEIMNIIFGRSENTDKGGKTFLLLLLKHKKMSEWYVYLLYSKKIKKSYVGCTTNVERRLRQHNGEISGGGKWTKHGRPWKILKKTKKGLLKNRSKAQVVEYKVKKGRGVIGRKNLIKKINSTSQF